MSKKERIATVQLKTGGIHQATAEDKKLYKERLKRRADREKKEPEVKEADVGSSTKA